MKKRTVLWILLLVGWGMCSQAQTHLFVSASATNDNGNGLNWENAKKTIQSALAIANNNTIIHVKVGEYILTSEFTIPVGVTVIGGYELSCTGISVTQRIYPGYNSNWDNPSLCTILSGNRNHRIATVQGTLEGCIVRYGRTSGNGAGVLVDGGTVTHCVLTNNVAYNTAETTQAKGGGAYVQNNGSLLNCVVCYNRADNGFGVAGMTGNVTNNTITQNFATTCGTVADYDGNVYKTVVIGDQCWMRENLRTTHYSDGTAISAGSSTSDSYAYYYNPGSSSAETQMYGLLYNRRAAWKGTTGSAAVPSGKQGICPTGWHLPSSGEFDKLVDFLHYDAQYVCGTNVTHVAKALASQEGWTASTVACAVGNDLNANNATLFTAQPAGWYKNSFADLNKTANFITSEQGSYYYSGSYSYSALYRTISYNESILSGYSYYGYYGYSVRCVKNE